MKSRSRKKLILIDNYDSFSYNLYQMLGALGAELTVIRNDEKTPEEIEAMKPDGILLSPGPGRPEDAGCCVEVVQKLGKRTPILGVCLGHQAICTAYGGTVTCADRMMHGKTFCDKGEYGHTFVSRKQRRDDGGKIPFPGGA